MSAIEADIVERFRQLDDVTKHRVLTLLENETVRDNSFDFEVWLQRVQALQTEIRATYGEAYTVGSQELLDELREETS
jgi:hypothetical protein